MNPPQTIALEALKKAAANHAIHGLQQSSLSFCLIS
jgi:hypothetical protein